MIEDPQKIIAKINQLNQLNPGQQWIALQGWNFMPTANFTPSGITVNQNYGFLVKVFLNSTTGETKTFEARLFFRN